MTEENIKKQVDEEWKKRAQMEQQASAGSEGEGKVAQPTFYDIVSDYVMRSLFFLGMLKDPQQPEHQTKVDPQLARLNIDMLSVLYDKTKGNLTVEEDSYLSNTLNELRMLYIKVCDTEPYSGGAGSKIITP